MADEGKSENITLVSGTRRSTVVNWSHFLDTIVDGYQQQRSIPYGVQKDAIQNGWDARTGKKGVGFRFRFELVKGPKHLYLAMTDEGTTGLTGRILKPSEYENNLPEEERWGRFESLAFSKEGEKSGSPLGSRGRGKFIFVGASKTRRIMYDSLRRDMTYRSGWRTVEKTESPIEAYDEDDGRKKLKQLTEDTFSPLEQVGTRVIIEDPLDEVVESVTSGEFAWLIGETWWEIVKKFNVEILVGKPRNMKRVTIPKEFVLSEESEGKKKVWLKGPEKVRFGRVEATVKKLHLVCEPDEEVREELRGVAIQRGGMKVCTVVPDVLPERIAYSMYGYVCLDPAGEYELRKAEDQEHNNISYNRPFAREFRLWLRSQMKEFAKEELGYSVDIRREKRERERAAEKKALAELNKIANRFNLLKVGPDAQPSGTQRATNVKQVYLQVAPPQFPDSRTRRVDYGQRIQGLAVDVVNKGDTRSTVRAKGIVRFGETLVMSLHESDLLVEAQTTAHCFGPMGFSVSEDTFSQPGPYTISMKLTSMNPGPSKGDTLDQRNIQFYVESDPPPSKGLFEAYEAIEGLSKENAHLFGFEDRGPAGGIVLKYNVEHPAYLKVQDDVDKVAEHLFRFGAIFLCKYDLESEAPKLFPSVKGLAPPDLVDQVGCALGRLMYMYHKATG